MKIPFTIQKKWFIRSMFISNPKARRYFTLVTPETILYRWKKALKHKKAPQKEVLKWVHKDLNLGQPDYESGTLTN